MNKEMICGICGLIILPNDNHLKLQNFRSKKKIAESFFHENCYRDRLQNKSLIYNLAQRTGALLNKAEAQLS